MGGLGSGLPDGRRKVENMLCLDIFQLQKAGLELNKPCLWTWTVGNEEKCSIYLLPLSDSFVLKFNAKLPWLKERQNVEQQIDLTRTQCHYGGSRPWFRCPDCGRRAAKLFAGHLFLCRHCHDLRYASQSEARRDRCLRRANKLRMKLGGKPGVLSEIPRPKGMHHHTYDRIVREIRDLELTSLTAAMRSFNR